MKLRNVHRYSPDVMELGNVPRYNLDVMKLRNVRSYSLDVMKVVWAESSSSESEPFQTVSTKGYWDNPKEHII